jgi:hypothetical protein
MPPRQAPFRMFAPVARVPTDEAEPRAVIVAAPGGRNAAIVEAFSIDDFVRAWIELLLDRNWTAGGQIRAGASDSLAEAGLATGHPWKVGRCSKEQSNTSIRIGERAILKVVRKLEEGIHPELEMAQFLTCGARFAATPALLGWIDMKETCRAVSATVSILQAFVPNQGDGWGWVLDRLRRTASADAGALLKEVLGWLRRRSMASLQPGSASTRMSGPPPTLSRPAGTPCSSGSHRLKLTPSACSRRVTTATITWARCWSRPVTP